MDAYAAKLEAQRPERTDAVLAKTGTEVGVYLVDLSPGIPS
jgi:hypothetical protein